MVQIALHQLWNFLLIKNLVYMISDTLSLFSVCRRDYILGKRLRPEEDNCSGTNYFQFGILVPANGGPKAVRTFSFVTSVL